MKELKIVILRKLRDLQENTGNSVKLKKKSIYEQNETLNRKTGIKKKKNQIEILENMMNEMKKCNREHQCLTGSSRRKNL